MIKFSLYVVAIGMCQLQHGKYFTTFSFFSTYFTSLYKNEIKKNKRNEDNIYKYCTKELEITTSTFTDC